MSYWILVEQALTDSFYIVKLTNECFWLVEPSQ